MRGQRSIGPEGRGLSLAFCKAGLRTFPMFPLVALSTPQHEDCYLATGSTTNGALPRGRADGAARQAAEDGLFLRM